MLDRALLNKGLAELVGTFALTSVVLAVLARTTFPFFVAVGAGLTLGLMVVAIGKISGAHINPAITIGMLSKKMINGVEAILYIAMQLLGAFLALGLYQYMSDRVLEKSYADFDWRVFTAEAVGALIFGFGVMAGVSQKLTQTGLAVVIGTSLTVGLLVATAGSNAILNPAVALGLKSFTLAYILGPIVGAVIGMHLFHFLNSSKKK